MTGPAITRCIKVFIVVLLVACGWTLIRVLGMLGWW